MSDGQKETEEKDAAAEGEEDAPAKKSPLMGILKNVGVAILLGGVVAVVVFFAPVGGNQCEAPAGVASHDGEHGEKKTKNYDEIAFVNLEPLVITLGSNARAEYLKISISLETTYDQVDTATHLEPRFRDVLNNYLRAVDEKDLIEPFAMTRLRAQMLRRLQTVASPEVVEDVLITDFVLN